MKRLLWLGAGFGLGIAAGRRVARRRGGEAPHGGRVTAWFRAHVSNAVAEGRQEAQRRERALRDVLASTRNGSRDLDK